MAKVYFGERQTVKSAASNKDGHVVTYCITINRQRLLVRAMPILSCHASWRVARPSFHSTTGQQTPTLLPDANSSSILTHCLP